MIPQLTHPSSATLLGELDSFFRKKIYTSRDRRLIFLCGGPVSPPKTSFRRKLLDHGQKALSEFRFFLAEDAARDLFRYENPVFINIAEFELILSDLADCVVLIPESPGSIAELGYFSALEKTREKLLVVTDLKFQGDESFLSLGPIELVNRHSKYRPTIQLSLNARRPNFRPIVKILKRYGLEIRGHFEYRKFDEMTIQHRLFVIFELIYLFDKLSYDAIELLIQSTFFNSQPLSDKQKQDVRLLLSVLCAGKYVQRIGDDGLLAPFPKAKPFFDIGKKDRNLLRLKIADFVRRTRIQNTPKQRRRKT